MFAAICFMYGDEIEVPKEIRQFMLENAEETNLGHKNGAKKQYRYGNLHIREYDDKFLVHTDKVDPRKDPLGHLIHDAPEVLIGLTCAMIGGHNIASNVFKKSNSKKLSSVSGVVTSLICGYLGYSLTKRIKQIKGD